MVDWDTKKTGVLGMCEFVCMYVCRRLGGVPRDAKSEAHYLLRFLWPVLYRS